MNNNLKKERFETFKLKTTVANRFRKFSRSFGKSQSITLLAMLDFFELNELSPDDRLGHTISGLKTIFKRRFNAVIAIIRDIEKNQIKPTNAMLQKLFEEASNEKDEEDHDFGSPTLITENEELVFYRDGYSKLQTINSLILQEIQIILDNIKYVKGNFGGGYLKLEMSKDKFETVKRKLKDVYNH